ncbi:hypothetical protein HRG_003863 [Hirsutella rhossiliensis]|uniref:Uncharacterized protein n=1 Tax=Hirsutella rhossiliensis TaxID=111463 RepID=A0A9P8N738_9HYPO|nr:uncharacterized protein HRG_03863 [Hirsutella rhossiliensis]KAH0965847.1 hypothetical protein HRG_03863 [Hirsutella rhossiliensis]
MPLVAASNLWDQAVVLLITALAAFVLGFVVGVFNVRGHVISPKRHNKRRQKLSDAFDSDETDVEDDLILDHAPNWANSEETDRQQGLRV